MIEWIPVDGSKRIVAEAFVAEEERIYVRFPDGVEWWYGACNDNTWQEFTSGSRGSYMHSTLDHKPNGRHG